MEWYKIASLILITLGLLVSIIFKFYSLHRDSIDNKKGLFRLNKKIESVEKKMNNTDKERGDILNKLVTDVGLINQKFDFYITQIVELNDKQNVEIDKLKVGLSKHDSCLMFNKSSKEIKEILNV